MSTLRELKVLELASVLAGPAVGQFFAELGADVIKVENLNLSGDVTRTWKLKGEKTDDRSAYFCSVNWGKRSVALDLTKPAGQQIVASLAQQSDIVIASYKPGDAEKLGVDYSHLSKNNPRLIYGRITGYGNENPRVGYDAIIQAEAGFMYMNGSPGGPSLKMPVALMDVLAGHQLKEGLLLALMERISTGKGQLVEVSLIESGIASLANQATNWLVANRLPEKQGSAHPNIAPYGDVFKTAEGDELILAVGSDSQFRSLCKVLGLEQVAHDIRFRTNPFRVEHRSALNAMLHRAIVQFQTSDLMAKLSENNVPAGVINDMPKVFQTSVAQAMILQGDGVLGVKSFAASNNPVNSSHILPPPHFGEHTENVLGERLQFSPESLKMLRSTGVIN